MRPAGITRFERLYFAAQAVSLINTGLHYQASLDRVRAGSGIDLGAGFIAGVLALSIAVPLLMWFLIARKASNGAKWTLVVLAGFSLFTFIPSMRDTLALGPLALLLNIVYFALYLSAVGCLFGRDAAAWFAYRGKSF